MNSSAFFAAIARRAATDTSVVSTLRGCLSADRPETHAPAFQLIEPLVAGQPGYVRPAAYLAAGCWASAVRQGKGRAVALPEALRRMAKDAPGAERRFVQLLDSDADELGWRLRQIVALVASTGTALDWPALLDDLLRWGSPYRSVQTRWARTFWGADAPATADA
jgi:CRISPR system Cascade subunit CasB